MVASSVGGLVLRVTEACQFSWDSSVPARPRLSSRHSIRQVAPDKGSTETTCTLTVSVSAPLERIIVGEPIVERPDAGAIAIDHRIRVFDQRALGCDVYVNGPHVGNPAGKLRQAWACAM
jgi:hypothetical protein